MKPHPAADLFPMLGEDELAALAEDIKQNGQIEPCIVFDGKLLDGRNRWAACMRVGVMPKFKTLERCDSPTAYVLSTNLHRRHLNAVQKAAVAADAVPLFSDEARQRQLTGKSADGEAGGRGNQKPSVQSVPEVSADDRRATHQAAAATKAGIQATKALTSIRQKAPDVFAAVKAGKVETVVDASRIANLPAEKREEVFAKIDAGVPSSKAVAEVKLDEKRALAATLDAQPVPLPGGRYHVIAIDPPWKYDSRAEDASHRGRNQYPDMTIEQLAKLPVDDIAEDDCVLWLWTTNAFMREAYTLLDVWGFRAKTILTWDKQLLGLGDYLRNVTEHCILAVRGRPVLTLTNQTTLISEKRREHSRKPDAFYALVDALCHGTKVEMFSREPRAGWAAWGAETDKFEGAA